MRELAPVNWTADRPYGHRKLTTEPFQRLGPLKSVAGALAATGTLLPPAFARKMLDHGNAGGIPMLWHKALSRSLGVRSKLSGKPADGSVLYVSNHISWLDIPVIGSHLRASFVAKSEVGEMGIVGMLADIQQTIYVERESQRPIVLGKGGQTLKNPDAAFIGFCKARAKREPLR